MLIRLSEDEPRDEYPEENDDDDYPVNPLVDMLFDEIENLRMQVSSEHQLGHKFIYDLILG